MVVGAVTSFDMVISGEEVGAVDPSEAVEWQALAHIVCGTRLARVMACVKSSRTSLHPLGGDAVADPPVCSLASAQTPVLEIERANAPPSVRWHFKEVAIHRLREGAETEIPGRWQISILAAILASSRWTYLRYY